MDATQELIAIGTSNVVNSFVQGYPGTGSLSRGAVNNASGVRTPMGGLFTGILVIASLFMTPLFYYIPKAALASIIIAAIIFMVEVRVVKPMWRSKSKSIKSNSNLFQLQFVSFDNNALPSIHRNRFDSRHGCIRCVPCVATRNWHPHRNDHQHYFHFVSCCPTKDFH